MAYTAEAKRAIHQGLLDRLKVGTGDMKLNMYANQVLLVELLLNGDLCSVHQTTGQLTIVPAGLSLAVGTGIGTHCKLFARDGAMIDDSIPVQAGVAPIPGRVVFNTLNIIERGAVTLLSAVIG